MTETFPDFFTQAPILRVRDPLAQFLGAAREALSNTTTPMQYASPDTPTRPLPALIF